MGKGKPRHNPDKRQNKMGADCPYYEEHHLGVCDGDWRVCKGNRYNCIKTFYHRLASRSDIQKQNGDYKRK